jgi:hypothetical protein
MIAIANHQINQILKFLFEFESNSFRPNGLPPQPTRITVTHNPRHANPTHPPRPCFSPNPSHTDHSPAPLTAACHLQSRLGHLDSTICHVPVGQPAHLSCGMTLGARSSSHALPLTACHRSAMPICYRSGALRFPRKTRRKEQKDRLGDLSA